MLDRVTTTIDSLAKIIQTLSSGGMSGRLIARREVDMRLEEGEIIFTRGKVAEAKAADRVGLDALNWMKTWNDCTFSFHPSKESQHIPAVPPEILSNLASTGNTTELRQTAPMRQVLGVKGKEPETSKLVVVLPTTSFSGAIPYRVLPNDKALQQLKAAKYSRIHRHIFLLVDGHRSVGDLMRLTGRDKDDIFKVLHDLEKIRIIRIPD